MKYCQGPLCHTYKTKDRLRGPKGDKHYQTRRRSQLMYHSFCSQCCVDDWFIKFGNRAVDHFGRIVEPIKLTEENAWVKLERYWGDGNPFYWYNRLTERELPLTKEQFNNPNYTRPRRSTVVVVEATNSNGEVIKKDTLRF